jgi:hypothetical protein
VSYFEAQGKFMKEVAILLLLALMLNGCGSSGAVQTTSGSVWGAQFLGGAGASSGFDFNAQFSFNGNGALSISNFELLNADTCFGTSTATPAGTLTNLGFNSADQITSGTFSFSITSAAGDVVTLTSSAITGTVNGNTSPATLTSGTITGFWALVPGSSGSKCMPVSSSSNTTFTMTLASTS